MKKLLILLSFAFVFAISCEREDESDGKTKTTVYDTVRTEILHHVNDTIRTVVYDTVRTIATDTLQVVNYDTVRSIITDTVLIVNYDTVSIAIYDTIRVAISPEQYRLYSWQLYDFMKSKTDTSLIYNVKILDYNPKEDSIRLSMDKFRNIKLNLDLKDCKGLTRISFSGYYLSNLVAISLPNSITELGSWSFAHCPSLSSVVLPRGITTIGSGAFEYCSALTSINIPEGVKKIDYWSFYGCSSLSTLILPESLTSIGDSAFASCTNLRIKIPKNVSHIAGDAFVGTGGKYNLPVIDENNPYFVCVENVLFNNDKTELISFWNHWYSSYTLPNSVSKIAKGAFMGTTLSSLTINKTVSFDYWTGVGLIRSLTINCNNFVFPDDSGYLGRNGTENITFGENVSSISSVVDYGDETIQTITLKSTTPPIFDGGALRISNNCKIMVPKSALNDYKSAPLWSNYANQIVGY